MLPSYVILQTSPKSGTNFVGHEYSKLRKCFVPNSKRQSFVSVAVWWPVSRTAVKVFVLTAFMYRLPYSPLKFQQQISAVTVSSLKWYRGFTI